jgi:1,2-dihydroxy-3-keto-5-methylthiopentene dioxygenase
MAHNGDGPLEDSMSLLRVLLAEEPTRRIHEARDQSSIAALLGKRGVRFERWTPPAGGGQPDPLAAYAREVERLKSEGFGTVDVVRLKPAPADPQWPAKAEAARAKFLEEHTHAEDEVRFFVEGAGLFYLRLGEEVNLVLCEAGDLLAVPAGTRHWFDMGTAPSFCAIRFFQNPDGWVGKFTGDLIARRFPTFDDVARAPW